MNAFLVCIVLLELTAMIATAADARLGVTSSIYEKKSYNTNLRHRDLRQARRRVANARNKNADGGEINNCDLELSQVGMSPIDLKRSAVAAGLSNLVYELKERPEADKEAVYAKLFQGQEERGTFYASGIDAVYTVKIRNEYCVVAFRGTSRRQENAMKDMESNFEVDPVEFDEKSEATEKQKKDDDDDLRCDLHSGYHNAYFDFEYRSGVEDFLKTCSEECPECDVVLTGHSQGGGIAEIAALYYKKSLKTSSENLYIITFGAPQALGAGCLPLFSKEDRCRAYRYVMSAEGPLGRGLVYDPVPMIYPRALGDFDNDGIFDESSASDSYARNGGLAYLGHELFLTAGDASALALGIFDGHYGADVSKYDLSTDTHDVDMYMEVLESQIENLLSDNQRNEDYECNLPTNGFSIGSLCNRDESDFHCAPGVSECKRNGWWWGSENTCQAIDDLQTIQNKEKDRFCRYRPLEWTFLP